MNCNQVAGQGIAELYVIGKLKSSLQDEFEVHVLECKTCLKTLEVLRGVTCGADILAPSLPMIVPLVQLPS